MWYSRHLQAQQVGTFAQPYTSLISVGCALILSSQLDTTLENDKDQSEDNKMNWEIDSIDKVISVSTSLTQVHW